MPSSPPQLPVTTPDAKSACSGNPAKRIPQPDPPSSIESLALPTQPPQFSSTDSPMIQPSPPSQSQTTFSFDSNSFCPSLPYSESAASQRSDQPAKISSTPFDSCIVDLPVKSRQSITPSFSFPGASGPATTYDRTFPDPADSHCTLNTASSTESFLSTSERMPNVYINGLPPHFSEQDLFALVRPFGDIKSVRTFTRHVSEKPTGYGFVLFNEVESAQRCIEGLRKYRNLHPSFSKQVHRIPGTEYAQHNAAQSTDQDENTFKSRMDKLKDTASTNLYIEGLPLSIDEESLAALMLPYKIKSSRFFKTKLSNPPRIIAFVRLETRTAAEETIERLHGRMVRGWNDPGCRISVRFADSAEQRELRRTERTFKNGEQSPSRLTIAQAALLNLHGQELQANIRGISKSKAQHAPNSRSDKQMASFGPASDSGLLPPSRSLPSNLHFALRESPLLPAPDLPIASEMDALLQSIQNMGYDDGSLDNTIKSSALGSEYLTTQQAQLRALASAALLSPNPLSITLPRGHTQARNGFTPAEELILEAHTQRLQLQAQLSQSLPGFEPISSLRKINSGIRNFDTASNETSIPTPGHVGSVMFSRDTLPTISEDDFHAMGHLACGLVPTSRELQGSTTSVNPSASTVFVRPPSRAVSIVPPPPNYEDPGRRSKGYHQRVERQVDSSKQTTFTSSSFNDPQLTALEESKLYPFVPQASTYPDDISSNNNANNGSTTTISRNKNIEAQHTYKYSHGGDAQRYPEDKTSHYHSSPSSQTHAKKSSHLNEHHSTVKDGPMSPAVVSPALTYSSRTPSTLSPATPFFGSFVGSQDAFEVMTMENEDVAERKLKARVSKK